MRRIGKFRSLEILKKSEAGIQAESPRAGTLEIGGLKGKILIEPDNVLFVQFYDLIENGTIFFPQLLAIQREILAPVKFVWYEPRSQMYLVGELPLNGGESLNSGFNILKEGFLHAKLLKKAPLKSQSLMSKGIYCKNGALSTKEARNLVDRVLKFRNYEVTQKKKAWIISLNTELYFQRIEILLNEMSHYLQFKTILTTVPMGDSLSKVAISTFLLHAAGRLRFVRGIMCTQEKSKKDVVALEVIVPLKYLKIFSPEVALESLIVATRYTKLPCEALLQKEIAEGYLKRWLGISTEQINMDAKI